MQEVPSAAIEHYNEVQRVKKIAVLAGNHMWKQVDPNRVVASWVEKIARMTAILSDAQYAAAESGASYGASSLAEQGTYVAPMFFVDPSAFAGVASDGRPLNTLLSTPALHAQDLIDNGMNAKEALKTGGKLLTRVIGTQVADAGRGAAHVDTVVKPRVNYVRMLNTPSCSRCSILAGRVYKWNAGFDRHPLCDCIHVQIEDFRRKNPPGFLHDPMEYFHSLDVYQQIETYGFANARAIRDGADIYSVVNSGSGMSKAGEKFATGGKGRRSWYVQQQGFKQFRNQKFGRRLTPDAIYRMAKDRDEAMLLLEKHAYIIGNTETYEERIHFIRQLRNPEGLATMTEAERKAYRSNVKWEQLLRGEVQNARDSAIIENNFRKYVVNPASKKRRKLRDPISGEMPDNIF